jgi:hypothetical protein
MNLHIQKLADEAGLRFTQLMSNPMVPVVDGRETDLEKFAELIVAECMFQCNINQAGNTPLSKDFNEGHIMGVYECFHKIRNHFGVKE